MVLPNVGRFKKVPTSIVVIRTCVRNRRQVRFVASTDRVSYPQGKGAR
jgi:hypothetical protein